MVRLYVFPQLAVWDEEIDIIVSELEPNSAVTISASIVHYGILYIGFGHFFSDVHGRLNVKEHVSYGGTYKGVQPMGLFSSGRSMPSKHSCPRFVVLGSVDQRLPFQINVWKGHLTQDQVLQLHAKHPSFGTSATVKTFHDKFFLAHSMLERTYLSPEVKRIPINVVFEDEQICGVLFMPNGKGPFPGVIDMHGGAGGCPEFRAALIAKNGFATLALGYMRYGNLKAQAFADVQISYFHKAIKWLSNHPMVVPNGVSMVGLSLGAEIVLLTTIQNANVRSTVSINSTIYMEIDPNVVHPSRRDGTEEVREIWHGRIRNISSKKIECPRPLLTHKHDTPILFLVGELDLYASVVDDTIDQLKRSGKKNVFKRAIEGQGHLIEPPYTPASVAITSILKNRNRESKDPYDFVVDNLLQEWGGDYEKHGRSQLEAWNILINFLKETSYTATSSKL